MFDITIIGAGASGMVAAVTAKRKNPDRTVLLLEALPRVGKKILSTGNGKCNLTNLNASYLSYNNKSVKEIIERYNPVYCIDFFKSIGMLTYTDSEGRVYPLSNNASTVLDCLRIEIEKLGINVKTDYPVNKINKKNGIFFINKEIKSKKIVVATGGKSSSSQGSDGSGYILLKSLGHRITKTYPGLVQLKTKENLKPLKGIRTKADVELIDNGKTAGKSKGEILFTDYGLSGIAIMDLSSKIKGREHICILDILPSLSETEILDFIYERKRNSPDSSAENTLSGLMPRKLAQYILKRVGINNGCVLSCLNKTEINKISDCLKSLEFTIIDTNGFNNSQVTVGGADVKEFNLENLESKIVKGLYCTGELLDIDAPCGGFNLQWAWASGIAVGENI